MADVFEDDAGGLRRRFQAYDWIPVTTGMSDATVFRLERRGRARLYAKLGPGMRAEAERIDWLRGTGIGGPELVDTGALDPDALDAGPLDAGPLDAGPLDAGPLDAGPPDPTATGERDRNRERDRDRDGERRAEWVVITAVPGRTVAAPWPEHQRMRVIDAAARQLRALHAVPVGTCPFERTIDRALADARRRQPDNTTLHAELARLRPPEPGPEDPDLAVCHGDYCTPNVLVDPETLEPTGLIDLGHLGRADRHADLALIRGSLRSGLNPQYAEEHVEAFLAAYGQDAQDGQGGRVDPHDDRLAYYLRLDWLF